MTGTVLSWFNLDHLGRSAGQFDEAKLRWVNAQHIKAMDNEALAKRVEAHLTQRGLQADARLPAICALFKDRCDTTVALADWAAGFYGEVVIQDADRAQYLTESIKPAIAALAEKLSSLEDWNKIAISAAFKEILAAHGLKMPHLAMPVRVLTLGTAHTPSVDAVLELAGKQKILADLKRA